MTEKVTALVVFGGDLNPDVDAAIAALLDDEWMANDQPSI